MPERTAKYGGASRLNERMETLTGYLPAGSTCYTVLRHVSRSGMLRRISPIAIIRGDVYHLDYLVADVLGRRGANGEGVKCSGAGMDMGFELVYSLAQVLYGDGYALNQRWI